MGSNGKEVKISTDRTCVSPTSQAWGTSVKPVLSTLSPTLITRSPALVDTQGCCASLSGLLIYMKQFGSPVNRLIVLCGSHQSAFSVVVLGPAVAIVLLV